MNYDTERGHVNKVIDSKKRRDRVQGILIVSIVVALLGVTWNAWQSELRAREAERNATSLAEQVAAACAREGADLLVDGEDICERADDVAEDASPTDGAAALLGPVGPAGPQGLMGPRGFAGLDGKDGEPGPAGEAGQTGATGTAGKDGEPGPVGPEGPQGVPGTDGREVQFQANEDGDIQWRYMGEATWRTLIRGEDLQGDPGAPGSESCSDSTVFQDVWARADVDGSMDTSRDGWVKIRACVYP